MSAPIVDTTEGKVRGNIRKNIDGEKFFCFLGIPYAKPPLGELRFKAPEPAEAWSGIRDATKEGSRIYQRDSLYRSISGTEDGLHLNVFTKISIPQNTKENKPVMVWIHSGGFLEGSNSTEIYGPEFLMTEDIVLVSINYRLGVLGLLQLEDPSLEIFGNAFIKDQIEALKWIQRNIGNFGGDPNNVTIFGESAGAGSVHYLVLSPAAKGLFHKAICQSGVAINKWAYGKPFTKGFLAYIGKEDMSEKEALSYLRSLAVNELFNMQESYFKSLPTGAMGVLSPILEQPNPTAVITKHPVEYLSSGDYNKVPILMGYNSNECLFFASNIAKTNEMVKMTEKISPENIVSQILNLDQESDVCKNLSSKLKGLYRSIQDGKYTFASDLLFIIDIIICARNHAKTSDKPVFLYKMSLDAGLNMMKKLLMIRGPGAVHFDDVGYLFKTSLKIPQRGSADDIYLRRFIKLWTNFAKFGNPTPEENDLEIIWKPFNQDFEYFLDIDRELILKTNPENERVKVWQEIYQVNPFTAKLL